MITLRSQLICAYSFIPFIVSLAIGLFILPHWLPPFSPGLSADAVAAIFRGHVAVRVGIAILAFFAPFFLGLWVAMAAQMRRIEGPGHVWSNLMLASAILQTMAVQLPCFPLLALMFQPEVSPQFFLIFATIAWFMFLGAAGQAVLQMVSIALCILNDGTGRVYPRWLGYINLLAAFSALPGVLLMFFKTGPLAWDGLIGFWFVLTGFGAWGICNLSCTISAINRQRAELLSSTAS